MQYLLLKHISGVLQSIYCTKHGVIYNDYETQKYVGCVK